MYDQNPLMFDMAVDEIAHVALEQADAEMEAARQAEDRKNQKIIGIVAAHSGEDVKDLPYIQQQSTASSSNFNPKTAEDPPRSRSRSKSKGRPPKTVNKQDSLTI